MEASETPVLSSRAGAVTTLTLNRPRVLNAITPEMLELLGDNLTSAAEDPEVRAVVLTGAGRAFSAGVDLTAIARRRTEDGAVSGDLNGPARRVTGLLSTMPKVTIAKVNGPCFTGALELALACDLMVVVEDAKMGDTHAKWGLRPTWGMSQRLVKVVGPARARELSFTARTFSGAEAAAWGMALQAVPATELDQAVDTLAATIADNSPGSIAAYKDLFNQSLERNLSDGLQYEYSTDYEITDSAERVASFKNRK
jgi:enoyl-CoA hydratase/carnithine racemase